MTENSAVSVSEEARLDDPLDPETERILQFVACDMVTPRSPYRGSYHLTCALRARIRTLIEEARKAGIAKACEELTRTEPSSEIGDGLYGAFR